MGLAVSRLNINFVIMMVEKWPYKCTSLRIHVKIDFIRMIILDSNKIQNNIFDSISPKILQIFENN